jgi:hypothetical protein
MTLTVHDNWLISYEVQCEARTIVLRTKNPAKNEPTKLINVVFEGVQGYRFENDAFGSIILDLETMPVERFLKEYGAEISESYRMAGSPGPWAGNLEAAPAYFGGQGVRAFVLSSSYGLSGWVLAQEISILPVQPDVPVDRPRTGAR